MEIFTKSFRKGKISKRRFNKRSFNKDRDKKSNKGKITIILTKKKSSALIVVNLVTLQASARSLGTKVKERHSCSLKKILTIN